MRPARALAAAGLVTFLLASPAQGGEPGAPTEPEWAFSASAMAYFLPDQRDLVSPALKADRGFLHFETRYNYEDRNAASVWMGCRFGAGKTVEFEATPMLGGVFGDTDGIAPGLELSLRYRKFELYSEAEYLFASAGKDESFFYAWSELSYSPVDWLRVGLVGQRTRVYQTELDLQRGFLVGFSRKRVDVTAYVLNLGWEDPTVVVSVSVSF